jgi:hypothetical protein
MNMKKGILLAVVIVLSTVGFAQAQEGELSGNVGITYLSKFIWRGFAWYDSDSATKNSVDLDLYGTGLGLNVAWYLPMTSGHVNAERVDLTLSYSGSYLEGETYATDYTLGWMYYTFPDQPSGGNLDYVKSSGDFSGLFSDMQEIFVSLSWPEICPAGVVPSYTVVRMWASESGSAISRGLSELGAGGFGGWLHVLGLGYDLPVEDLLPELPEQILHLSLDVTYNDGVLGVDNDWSHAVLGATTDFDLGNDLTLTPGVFYQQAFEHTNLLSEHTFDDQLWCSLGLKYSF